MHLKFQTRLQAKKAISKNGTVLGSTIMVGVSPCSDSSVLENLNSSVTSPLHDTSINQSVSNINSSLGTPRSIRPLTQAYKDAQGEFKVVPNTNTPNKNSGLVSKAMGCMFGW
jgi:nuclear pore complex protein Nup53